MDFDDEDLLKLRREGGRIVSRGARPASAPEKPSDAALVVAAIHSLAEALSERPPAPEVTVQAPNISVKAPVVNIPQQPTAWDVEILERDRDGIKRLRFTAVK